MQADSTQDRSLEVRPADLDHPGIAALLATHTRRARGAARCRPGHALGTDALRDPAIEVWSLWRNDAPVAVGAIRRLSGEHGELKSMFVADGERGNGIGRVLLAHLIDAAKRRGMTRLSLETGTSEYFDAARRLYGRQGFEACEAFADLPAHSDSVFMARLI